MDPCDDKYSVEGKAGRGLQLICTSIKLSSDGYRAKDEYQCRGKLKTVSAARGELRGKRVMTNVLSRAGPEEDCNLFALL